MDLMVSKCTDGSLRPVDNSGIELIKKLSVGKDYGITLKQLRKSKFHRKIFALLNFAYENTERVTTMYRGQQVGQSFDAFRNGLMIMAGHYELDVLTNGGVTYRAKSLSYDKLTQDEAEQVYSDLLDTIAQRLFNAEHTPEKLEQLTNEWMSYT